MLQCLEKEQVCVRATLCVCDVRLSEGAEGRVMGKKNG